MSALPAASMNELQRAGALVRARLRLGARADGLIAAAARADTGRSTGTAEGRAATLAGAR